MKIITSLCVFTLALSVMNCKMAVDSKIRPGNLDLGKNFVDAFYAFNSDTLQTILSEAKTSQPEILYYQRWAECAHYKILDRSRYFEKNDSTVIFPVTVKDDLMAALNIDFNVTDTFHIIVQDGKIRSVTTSSNDPDAYYEAKEWVKKNRPEFIEKACVGIWAGGPTPCECVLGMLRGFTELQKAKSTRSGQRE
jgi:hypothetical protein